MHYRELGRSGLRMSVLTLGTMGFGAEGGFRKVGTVDATTARKQIDLCLAAGVNSIDTADVYSLGLAEEILGKALGNRRDQVILTSKVRFAMDEGPNDAGLTKHHIISGCEASLRRLGTDYLDLYLLHERDGRTPAEETMEALDLLVRQGKVRYIGASNFTAWQVMKYQGVAQRQGLARFVAQQIHYSLLSRDAEWELLPMGVDEGIGAMVWSPLAGGMLAGKYRRDSDDEQHQRRYEQLSPRSEPPIHHPEDLFCVTDVLAAVAERHQVSMAQVALAYLLTKPGVTTIVIGGRTAEQVRDSLACTTVQLSAEDLAALDEVSGAAPLPYPHWHQAATAADRLSTGDQVWLGRR